MTTRRLIVGIGLVFCIFAAFAAPVSAGPMQVQGAGNSGNDTGPSMPAHPGELTQFQHRVANPEENGTQIRERVQIREESRSVWSDYRLKLLELRIESAQQLLATFEENGVAMGKARKVLEEIEGLRDELAAAFEAGDREAVREVYDKLRPLWKEFRTAVREAVRAETAENWFEQAFLRGEHALERAGDVIPHLADEGYEVDELKELYATAESACNEARTAYDAGDREAAEEGLREFRAAFSNLIDAVHELVGETDETRGLGQAYTYTFGQTEA
jgi:hypothetical protein